MTTIDESQTKLFRFMSSSSTKSSKIHNSQTVPTDLNRLSKTVKQSLPSSTIANTVGLEFDFDSTYTTLRELTDRNCQYFSTLKTDISQKFERSLTDLLRSIDLTMPLIRYLSDNFHHFDYSSEVISL